MDVLVVHNSYRQHGGEDEVFRAEVGLLKARGHRVIVHHVSNTAFDNQGLISLGLATVWNQQSYVTLRRLIRDQRPQVVHMHNTLPLVSPSAYYAAKREGIPVIQTLHNYRLLCPAGTLYRNGAICTECVGRAVPLPGIAHRCYRDSPGATAAIAAMLGVHRMLGTWRDQIDRYLALSHWSRDLFVEAGLPAKRIQVKPNFLFPDPRNAVTTRVREKRALFVGRLTEEKGVRTLLRAWQGIGENIPLDIIGDGPLAVEVDRATREMPGVRWHGAVAKAKVYEAMATAQMLIAPSEWYEPFGLSVVEAYALGMPVIASKVAGLRETIREGRTGLHFEPGDANQLRSHVIWMASADTKREAMGIEARYEFERHYTAEANYGQLMEAYRMAIGGRSSTRMNAASGVPMPGVRFFPV